MDHAKKYEKLSKNMFEINYHFITESHFLLAKGGVALLCKRTQVLVIVGV